MMIIIILLNKFHYCALFLINLLHGNNANIKISMKWGIDI